jgi:hypothetical protein
MNDAIPEKDREDPVKHQEAFEKRDCKPPLVKYQDVYKKKKNRKIKNSSDKIIIKDIDPDERSGVTIERFV